MTDIPPGVTKEELAEAIRLLRDDKVLAGQAATAQRLEAMEERLRRMPVKELSPEEKAAEYDRLMTDYNATGQWNTGGQGGGLPPYPPGQQRGGGQLPPADPPTPPSPPAPTGTPPAPAPKGEGTPPADPPRGKWGSGWLGHYE